VNREKWIIKDLLDITSNYLKSKDINSPRLNAEILLAHQLNTDRIRLYLDYDQPLCENDISSYRLLIKRLLKKEPVQYITGTQEFRSIDFIVDPNVLIPRPETEVLVEQALDLCAKYNMYENDGPSILDMGTGSGAIAVSIATELRSVKVWASDISRSALDIARLNTRRHGTEDRIQFIQGDLFEPFRLNLNNFDIIISNSPYVTSKEYDSLPPEVRDYEPRTALDGHEDGLFFIKRIIKYAVHYLKPGGWLLLEMDPRQAETVLQMTGDNPSYGYKKIIKDYSHKDRGLIAQKTN
jgi:release factor glutamine methyltransferase